MSTTPPIPAEPGRWKRPAYLVLIIAALATVMFAWFYTPTIVVASDGAGNEDITLRCANAGPSRWEPPTVHRSQELEVESTMLTFNQRVLKSDIESLRADLACDQARDRHTNTLVVTTFAAGTAMFLGYGALWARRDRPAAAAAAAMSAPAAATTAPPSPGSTQPRQP